MQPRPSSFSWRSTERTTRKTSNYRSTYIHWITSFVFSNSMLLRIKYQACVLHAIVTFVCWGWTIGLRRVNLNNHLDVEDFEPSAILWPAARGKRTNQHWSPEFINNSMWVRLAMAWIYTIIPWCFLVAYCQDVSGSLFEFSNVISQCTSITLASNDLARDALGCH